jgi:transposase InsO family protein
MSTCPPKRGKPKGQRDRVNPNPNPQPQRKTYNHLRPHSALGWKTPAAYAADWRA